jgi:hypothetical protein
VNELCEQRIIIGVQHTFVSTLLSHVFTCVGNFILVSPPPHALVHMLQTSPDTASKHKSPLHTTDNEVKPKPKQVPSCAPHCCTHLQLRTLPICVIKIDDPLLIIGLLKRPFTKLNHYLYTQF